MADLGEGSSMNEERGNFADSEMATAVSNDGDDSYNFTSEIFKIEIGNLPKVYSVCHLKKFLVKLKLQPKKVKMVPQRSFAFVTFKCEEDRELALKTLHKYEWRNRLLTAKMAKAKEDPFEKKKQQVDIESKDVTNRSNEGQDVELLDVDDALKRIRDVVTPLWSYPYEEQQRFKYEAMSQVLRKLTKEMNGADVGHWVKQNSSQNSGMCCVLEDLLPSPVCESYRNKCEFTIGPGVNGIGKTVGFRLSAYKEGCSAVVEPNQCTHIPQAMKHVIQEFQCYIRESPLDVFEPSSNKGFWRQLTLRTTLNDDIMCIIQISPAHDMIESDVESEIEKLTNYFRHQSKIKLTSVYVEILSARKTDEDVLRHVLGDKFIFESLCDLTFRISPKAFFQVNTKSAQVLYKAIQDWADVSSNTIILDVCCGTGTIGLSMAKNVRKLIGFELCPEAVEDAKYNAQSNGITNVEFHCGKAQDVVVKTTMALDDDKSQVVAILDPPRSGCHNKVLQAVRRCSSIKKLIYVSCSPSSVLHDFVKLCRPVSKRTKGDPFQMMKALPVDLFPQTRCCELVVLFER